MTTIYDYIEIFYTTNKWDRKKRQKLLSNWYIEPKEWIDFPKFNSLFIAESEKQIVHFTNEFHQFYTFPLLQTEITKKNLDAIRFLYNFNLTKPYENYEPTHNPLFQIGLIIDPSDLQMKYEYFLSITQNIVSFKNSKAKLTKENIQLIEDYITLSQEFMKTDLYTLQLKEFCQSQLKELQKK